MLRIRCRSLEIDYKNKTVEVKGISWVKRDYISINGNGPGNGLCRKGETKAAELSGDFAELMTLGR